MRGSGRGHGRGQRVASEGFRVVAVSSHDRRHDDPSGPVMAGVLALASRRRAAHQSVARSSASTATSVSIRAANARTFSPWRGDMGRPKVTAVRPGWGPPSRGMMRAVPSRWTGSTGRSPRVATRAAPALCGVAQPSGLRVPSG